jgi:sialic acid synthase SpsE
MLEIDFNLCKHMVEHNILTFCSLGKWNNAGFFPFLNPNVVYFHCVSKYPHNYNDAMEKMPLRFEGPLLGYSDHSIGISSCMEAVKRGATFIEKHFTLNHDLQSETEGAHICSMNVRQLDELRSFCDNQKHV